MNDKANYIYDVFISYSHADQDWVRNWLQPWLEAAGLRVCIDHRDFEIGRALLDNIEWAVDNSRHTLLVLTPAWIESQWTDFECLLIGTADPAGRKHRLIPLMLKACDLPHRIAMLTYADFTRPSEREMRMGKLVKSLSPTASTAPAAPSDARPDEPKPDNIFSRMLSSSKWQGISAIVGIIACLAAILALWPTIQSWLGPIPAGAATPISPPLTPTPPVAAVVLSETPTDAPIATFTPLPSPTPSPTETPTAAPTPTFTRTVRPPAPVGMVRVAAGSFLMGSLRDSSGLPGLDRKLEPEGDEFPQRTVLLPEFWIDRTEVTNVKYRACVTAKACPPPSGGDPNYFSNPAYDNHPVVFVSWSDADKYCRWAGKRLPSEAEWEKAARGTDGRIWPWGNALKDNVAGPVERANVSDGSAHQYTQVGAYPKGASPYGALDMAGNVWEWVNDWYSPTYYAGRPAPDTSPPGPSEKESLGKKVIRGGSFNTVGLTAHTADRNAVSAGPSFDIGFRCADD